MMQKKKKSLPIYPLPKLWVGEEETEIFLILALVV